MGIHAVLAFMVGIVYRWVLKYLVVFSRKGSVLCLVYLLMYFRRNLCRCLAWEICCHIYRYE